uniref:Large ribosomal subunit protein bL17m n=1 Tax=Clastoptera arizonana TaxID=38151 RepID=A0A1B6D5W7_9HEMI
MNQADVSRLVSKLRFKINPTHRKLQNPKGPEGRINNLRETVTGLIKYERLEMNYHRADEARGYAERLISDAIRYGDCHKPTMEMANYWLLEKQLVHKLFKVLVPRYENHTISYTRMFKSSRFYPEGQFLKAILELRGNPYPPLNKSNQNNRNLIHNVLLDEAKKEYRIEKYSELAEKLSANTTPPETSTPFEDSKKTSTVSS